MATADAILEILEHIFKLRDFSFEGVFGTAEKRKEGFDLSRGLIKDIPKGRLTAKTLLLLQKVLLRAIKSSPFLREAKRTKTSFQRVSRDKFIIKSENPGHGFLVQFTPFSFEGAGSHTAQHVRDQHREFHFEARTPEEHEEFHAGRLPPAGRAIRDFGRSIERAVTDAFHFFERVQEAPEDFVRGIPRFGQETPAGFQARRRRETGRPPRPPHSFLDELLEFTRPHGHHDQTPP